jgi:mRNA degradation ribonuclease J1/J2
VKSDAAGVSQQLSSPNENILEQYAGAIAGIFLSHAKCMVFFYIGN